MTVFLLPLQVRDKLLRDEIQPDRFGKKEWDSRRAEGALISCRSQSFVRAVMPLTVLIWRLPPFTIPLIFPAFSSFSLLFCSFSVSFLLHSISFFLSPPPTRAPSPLFSRRLISGAASQQDYLRKEKAPLLLFALSYPSVLHLSVLSFARLPCFSSHFNIPSSLLFHTLLLPKSHHNVGFKTVTMAHVSVSLCVCVCVSFKCVNWEGRLQ